MPTVVIDGVEYVPRAEVPVLTDVRLRAALQSLTEMQHFAECRHKHRAWGWDALNALAPELAALAAENPQAAFERVRGETAENATQLPARTLGLRYPSDETLEVVLGDQVLARLTHDAHGWAGLSAAENLARKVGAALGVPVVDLEPD